MIVDRKNCVLIKKYNNNSLLSLLSLLFLAFNFTLKRNIKINHYLLHNNRSLPNLWTEHKFLATNSAFNCNIIIFNESSNKEKLCTSNIFSVAKWQLSTMSILCHTLIQCWFLRTFSFIIYSMCLMCDNTTSLYNLVSFAKKNNIWNTHRQHQLKNICKKYVQ